MAPEKNPRRKSESARRANRTIRSRTLLIMVLFGMVTFVLLFFKLYDLQVNQRADLQKTALAQQTRSTVISPNRGTIYDRNHYELAISATAETLILAPKEVLDFVKAQEEARDEAIARAKEKKTENFVPKPIRDEDFIVKGLARILDMEEDALWKRMEKVNSQYEIIAKKMDATTADEVRKFLNGWIDETGTEIVKENSKGKRVLKENPDWKPIKLRGIYLQPDSKRVYPYGAQAANVLGFVDSENHGAYGLESKYDDLMAGASGFTISAKDNWNQPLLHQFEQYHDAENGNDLVLTIDNDVQATLEKGLARMERKFDAKNGSTGIVMDVNSGAILGMACTPTFDANAHGKIQDEKLKKKLDAQLAKIDAKRSEYKTEEDYKKAKDEAVSNALGTQWRNKTLNDTYEPGSTYKPITLAMALEEGVVDMNSTFECSGSVMVPGWHKPFHCSRRAGHGHETLEVAVGNSCNPAFINMAMRVGTQKYYEYFKSFGLMEPTGIDLIGEATGLYAGADSFNSNVVSLASYSFGQTFTVTPIQLIRAQAACINGGYLYTPYVVDQVLDENGNILEQHGDPVPVRQVVSEETSAKVRQCLEYVVAHGTGKNGQVAGYRIGGKTGTADKTGTRTKDNPRGDVVVSFMCFAPADNPKYIMLLTLDTPSRNTGTFVSGGNMVAPTASQIMAEILPSLGIEPNYSAEELSGVDAPVPNTVGLSQAEAQAKLEAAGFSCRTVGNGKTVTDQTPAGGAIVPNNASIILYMGLDKPSDKSIVPNVIGKSAAEANRAITNAGLIMRVAGITSAKSGNVHAITQSHPAGTELPPGEVVTVQFGDGSVLD